jgi:DNA-binding transcriptional LysR family regulator
MNLRAIDLNLLVVLDALLDEAHVSRAARRLNLSQPATSASLARLRRLFDDPLLERFDGAMRLTPTAESLRVRLKDLLAQTDALFELQPPALATVQRAVRVATADHMAARVTEQLHTRLAASAPGIDLVFQPYHGPESAVDGLMKATTDLAITRLPHAAPPIRREELFEERWRVLMRRDHPAASGFDLERWLAYPHVSVSGVGDPRGSSDETLAKMGLARRVSVVVPSFLIALPLLRASDLICLAPTHSLPLSEMEALVAFPPPVPIAPFTVHLAWHARHDADVATQHVANTLRTLAL